MKAPTFLRQVLSCIIAFCAALEFAGNSFSLLNIVAVYEYQIQLQLLLIDCHIIL